MATTGFGLDGLPPPPPDEGMGAGGDYVAPPETNLLEQDLGDDQGSAGTGATAAAFEVSQGFVGIYGHYIIYVYIYITYIILYMESWLDLKGKFVLN